MPPLGQESTQFRVNTGRSLKDLFQYNISVIRKLTQAPDRQRSATNSRIWPIANLARRSLRPPGFADGTWYLRRTVMPSVSLRAMLRRRPAFSCQWLWSFTARAITRAPTNLAYVAMALLRFAATVFPGVKRDRNSSWCFSVDHTTGRLDRQEFFHRRQSRPCRRRTMARRRAPPGRLRPASRIGLRLLSAPWGGMLVSFRKQPIRELGGRPYQRKLSVARVRQRALRGSSSRQSFAEQDSGVRCCAVKAAATTRR